MVERTVDGVTYVQTFNANNKLAEVENLNTGEKTTFTYDGNGTRVKKQDAGGTTFYVGGIYELKSVAGAEDTVTKYYYAGAQRVAMRTTTGGESAVVYLHGDHLGSTSLTTDAAGAVVARVLYYPYGEERYTAGTLTTDYGYTGQRNDSYIDMIEMGARWYDPKLARWASADTIVPEPGNPQNFNRFMYVLGNSLKYVDPSGHCSGDPNDPENPDAACWEQIRQIESGFQNISIDPDNWTTDELAILMKGLEGIYVTFDSDMDAFEEALGDITIHRRTAFLGNSKAAGMQPKFFNHIYLYDGAFDSSEEWALFTIAHEVGHVYDFDSVFKGNKSSAFVREGVWPSNCTLIFQVCYYAYGPSGTAASDYAKTNSAEDFADTFAVHVFNENDWNLPTSRVQPDEKRLNIIKNTISLTVQSVNP